ncbi:DUF254-domain-containing protein [Tricholoma matsutake]|nr:DUF254-domain-containing protein [Tricholoma matsutake 945]
MSASGLRKTSPSRLAPLRPAPSLSSLHIHGHGLEHLASPSVPPTSQALESSSSSVFTVDLNEGILLQSEDTETEEAEELTAISRESDVDRIDEDSKRTLRDQLRRTLSSKASGAGGVTGSTRLSPLCSSETAIQVSRYSPRQYYVLTDAGKPVFTSCSEDEDSDNMASTIGVMQALISVFLDDNDKLRCINAGRTRITVLLRPPLYFACVSSWGEPESVTRSHLEYLHLQILSIVTASQLRRIFERRTNFDLRRLLDGAESFLNSLLDRLEFDLSMSTSSLHCLKLETNLRKRAAEALVPTSKIKDILYIVLLAQGRVVTLIRPRKHSIHPADIHILLNTVHSPSIANSPASSSWIPICLPKFNPSGFVNAYVSFLRKDDVGEAQARERVLVAEAATSRSPSTNMKFSRTSSDQRRITLLCISGGGDLDIIRAWCDTVAQRLEKDGTLASIADACDSRSTEYSVSDLGIPGLRHFVYKSRSQVQVTVPMFEDPYDNMEDRRRQVMPMLATLYQILHDAIHAKSSQQETLKLQYIRTEKESVMGWITQPFELYIALSPRLPKSAAIGAANAVTRWVNREESRLFLKDAPVF